LNQIIIKELSQELNIKPSQVETVLSLLEENTVPFIARYRKEQTGDLDEGLIREIALNLSKSKIYTVRLKKRKKPKRPKPLKKGSKDWLIFYTKRRKVIHSLRLKNI